jgi:hypothetical protein
MKLRCTENSLRLRVRKSDLEVLQKNGSITATVIFALDQKLEFTLKTSSISAIYAEFTGGQITVFLPASEAEQWISSQQVGLEKNQVLPDGQYLNLLIEKDFPCQHVPENQFNDTFHELVPPQEG